MKNRNCGRCHTVFTPRIGTGHAFCSICEVEIMNQADKAALYQRRIAAGDINVRPETEEDARTVRRQIRRRLSSEPDCQYSHKKRNAA